MNSAPSSTAETALAAHSISKNYGHVRALDDVSLEVLRGTVHCLVGENGSGKSTLMKIIAGVESPDNGTVTYPDGVELSHPSPRRAIDAGVRVIYQDFALFENLTIAENLALPANKSLSHIFQFSKVRARSRGIMARVGLSASPDQVVEDLSVAEKQLVAIARALDENGRIILMDEPTAALTTSEIERLLELVRDLRSEGISFIFVSHKLREVISVADDVTVLRNGSVVGEGPAHEFDLDEITRLMTGSELSVRQPAAAAEPDAVPVVELQDASVTGGFTDVSVALHCGRTLGLAGVVGSGRSEIGLALAGLIKLDSGQLKINGTKSTSARAIEEVQYTPEDRLSEGLILEWSIADNIVAKSLQQVKGRMGLLDSAKERNLASRWQRDLSIKTDDVSSAVSTLSGGNQQRVLVARALAARPKALVLNNPTVGVDVGSRDELHELIAQTADDGVAVLVISDEPAELLETCNEIVVVRQGRSAGMWSSGELDEDKLWNLIVEEREDQ